MPIASAPGHGRWLPRPPGQCAVCLRWQAQALCADCLDRHAQWVPRCARCGLRLAAPAAACGACLAESPPYAACSVAFDYGFPWDRLIADFKFGGQVARAGPLAQRLLQAVRHDASGLPDWVLPVPLSASRLAQRGYNQAWELARRIARALGLRSDATLLLRHLEGAPQASLGLAQRRANLNGAFVVDPARRISLQGAHVALVDDVMTSGATLAEAARALQRAGAARVDAWVLARTPAPAD